VAESIQSLAERVSGQVLGPSAPVVASAAGLDDAGPTDISYVQDSSQLNRLERCRAGVLLVPEAISQHDFLQRFARIVVADPQAAFLTILAVFRPERPRPPRGISPSAVIASTAQIGRDCYIGPHVAIGEHAVVGDGCDLYPGVVIGDDCRLGRDCILYPHAVLYPETILQDRVIVHSQAVLGADGFGYRFSQGRFHKIPQVGSVLLGDDVEIGAGTMVDRGALGVTRIGSGSKIDNLVQIAHNCSIGEHNVFASQVGLAGSCKTGRYVRLAGQVGVKDHVTLHDGCTVGAKGGVHKDIPAGETWIGYPAEPEAEQKRVVFSVKRLPQLRDQVRQMERQVKELTAALETLRAELALRAKTTALQAVDDEQPPLRAAG
jgi:UDP-3-O-[3-hydroxymyristoyl] glucosamine N-acyltransferase